MGDIKVQDRKELQLFLASGFHHLPRGSPRMFRVEEVIQNGVVVALHAHLTNTFDAFYLLGRVFLCGCEFITFTTHNMFTEHTNIFPTASRMHSFVPHRQRPGGAVNGARRRSEVEKAASRVLNPLSIFLFFESMLC